MKRILLTLALAAALPLAAQQTALDANVVVATVNGETITKGKLDQLWNRIGERMRKQYEKSGGKMAFLQNYVSKRLLLQQAIAGGFDKQPAVQAELEAAKESALFDLYVRDVIAPTVITDDEVRKFYDDNRADFTLPERAKVREILIRTDSHSREDARAAISKVMTELFAARTQIAATTGTEDKAKFTAAFAAAAAKYSEHPTAPAGGDLGWVDRSALDPKIADAAFKVRPGMMSGILETAEGFVLVLVEQQQAAGVEPYEAARPGIREFLLGRNAQRVMEAVSNATHDAKANAKVQIYAENVQ